MKEALPPPLWLALTLYGLYWLVANGCFAWAHTLDRALHTAPNGRIGAQGNFLVLLRHNSTYIASIISLMFERTQ